MKSARKLVLTIVFRVMLINRQICSQPTLNMAHDSTTLDDQLTGTLTPGSGSSLYFLTVLQQKFIPN